MIGDGPFPQDVSFPVHLDHTVIQQFFVGYLGIVQRLVYQDQSIAFQWLCVHAGNIISYRIAFPLIVMVLARHPAVIPSRVVDFLKLVKFPYDISVIIDLDQVDAVLHSIIRMTVAG